MIERFRANAPDPDTGAAVAARARLMEVLVPRAARRAPRRRRSVRPVAALGTVAAALAIALAVPALLPGTNEPSAAAETLRRAALVAADQPWTPVASGRYVYTETRAMWQTVTVVGPGDSSVEFENVEREIWINPDGSGRIREVRDGEASDETFGRGELHFEDLSAVSTDLAALRAFIEERAGQADPPTDYEMFVVIGDLLRETHASPELRAALYEVAATLPRVELLGELTDEAGRPGVGVGYTHLGIRHELIFDPDTSAILGERQVQVDPPVADASPPPNVGVNADGVDDPGTLLGWAVYLRSGVVDSVDERP